MIPCMSVADYLILCLISLANITTHATCTKHMYKYDEMHVDTTYRMFVVYSSFTVPPTPSP